MENGEAKPQVSAAVVWLGVVIIMFSLLATIVGLFWQGGPGAETVTSIRGDSVEVYGQGIYRWDSTFSAGGNMGTDAVTLVLGIPFLAVSLVLYRRGSLRGRLLLIAVMAYFLYVYSSVALGTAAFNSLFLVYVVLFSASLFALILLLSGPGLLDRLSRHTDRLPRRFPAVLMYVGAFVTFVVWFLPLPEALLSGGVPDRMEASTTFVTGALDLGVIVPAAAIAGTLVLRRSALGHALTCALLGIIVLLGPVIIAQTVVQLTIGISFTPGEVIGPIAGFMLVAVASIWALVAILRGMPRCEGSAERTV